MMFAVKRIVAGADLSWYAGRAETRAAMLARELGESTALRSRLTEVQE
ncbi:MAG: hypothetical protein Q8O25_15205 [Sulfurisoma sp.]|nr:hypothetical protein [Sulfurisoma sp.]